MKASNSERWGRLCVKWVLAKHEKEEENEKISKHFFNFRVSESIMELTKNMLVFISFTHEDMEKLLNFHLDNFLKNEFIKMIFGKFSLS